jgi:Ser/Thr protein kinase RdoA (MazF antagonist)
VLDLAANIARSLGDILGHPGPWLVRSVEQRGCSGPRSLILHGYNSATGQSVAIKANSEVHRNREQFAALRSLRAHTEECVAPVALSEDGRFFVMDWVDAPLLSDTLGTHAAGRRTAIIAAASWLAKLHSVTLRRVSAPGSRSLDVFRLPCVDPARVGMTAISASERLRARVSRCKRQARAGPVVMLHSDFKPENLFSKDGRVIAFDRQFNCHGIAFLDVAHFLSCLAQLRDAAAADGNPWDGDAESDRRHFFEGYGPLKWRDLELFDLVEDVLLFRRWYPFAIRGLPHLDRQMQARGLLEQMVPKRRPGRLAARWGFVSVWKN